MSPSGECNSLLYLHIASALPGCGVVEVLLVPHLLGLVRHEGQDARLLHIRGSFVLGHGLDEVGGGLGGGAALVASAGARTG